MAIDVETLMKEIRALPPEDRRRLQRFLAEEADDQDVALPSPCEMTDEEYQQRLVQAGLLSEVRPRRRDQPGFERFKPVPITGKPLSETIVEERR